MRQVGMVTTSGTIFWSDQPGSHRHLGVRGGHDKGLWVAKDHIASLTAMACPVLDRLIEEVKAIPCGTNHRFFFFSRETVGAADYRRDGMTRWTIGAA